MDFTFTAEQNDVRRMMRDVVADHCTSSQLRAVIADSDAYDARLWSLVARELGLVGIAVSEANGGTGGSFIDAGVVLEEAGAALCPIPLLTGIVAAAALERSGSPAAAEMVAAVASGERGAVLVVAPEVSASGGALFGTARHVVDGHRGDLLVVAAADGLWAVDAVAPGVSVDGVPSLDLTRWQATIGFDGASVQRLGNAPMSASAVDLMRVALAVEAVGAARRCVSSTVDYLKTRVQFGKPIGSFQALQHRAAELAVDVEAAASTAYYAAWAAADSPSELAVLAPLALSVCAEAAYRIAAETIQLHGGIGFTWEHDAHLFFKRASATRQWLGDAATQRRLVAARANLL